jgi:hypothetical protein
MGTLSDIASNTILKCEVLGFHSSDQQDYVFWDMALCSLADGNQHFRGPSCLQLVGRKVSHAGKNGTYKRKTLLWLLANQ